MAENDFFALLPFLTDEMKKVAEASRQVTAGITEAGLAMIQENDLLKIRLSGDKVALAMKEAEIEKTEKLARALKEGLSPSQIEDIAKTLDEKLVQTLKELADAAEKLNREFMEDLRYRELVATGQTDAAAAFRFQLEQEEELRQKRAAGATDAVIAQTLYVQGLEREMRAKDLAREAAEKAAEAERVRLEQNLDIDRETTRARILLAGVDTEEGRRLQEKLDRSILLEEREKLLSAAVDEATRSRYEELFALQDQASASARAAEEAKKLAERLKELADFTFDVDVQYLRDIGKEFDAELMTINNRFDEQVKKAKDLNATKETMDKIEFSRQQAINRLIQSTLKVGEVSTGASGGGSTGGGSAMDSFRSTESSIVPDSVMGSIGGVTETSFGSLLDYQQTIVAVLRRIEANTASRNGPPASVTVNAYGGAAGGEELAATTLAGIDEGLGRLTRAERLRRGRQ
jgi:hypothetical protein